MCEPDEALVAQSQQGDLAAFEKLIRKHQRMIHSLTFRMTGSMADAEDLSQETFVRAYRNLAAYRADSKFSTWLYRIAINVCLNWRDRESVRAQTNRNWTEHQEIETDGSSNGGIEQLNAKLHAALLKLPAKQRAAVMLTMYDGMNHAEAAQVLNCSETTVSWRVFAAKRKLKHLLSRTGERE
ncbi:MAG: polymerase sigma factor RpoE [Verrucomicrobiales bacterium]|nr:polymerase sigma factor RpoE [Verrucomicrobiales bacterium]